MTANMACYYCCKPDEFRGNIIFKKINTKLSVEGGNLSEEDKRTLDKCQQQLNYFEEERKKIAENFRNLLIDTGACVLMQPNLERAIITYVIYFFEQILLCAKEKSVEFDKNDFSLTNFITIKEESPFIAFNQQALDNIKTKYGFDINMIESLQKGQRSIINFLTTITSTKTLIEKQYDSLKSLLTEFRRSFALVNAIKDSLEGLKFLINYFKELTKSLVLAQGQLSNPIKLELFYRIAKNAAEKNVKDPKEIALIYSYGENCGDKEKFEENLDYKPMEILKY